MAGIFDSDKEKSYSPSFSVILSDPAIPRQAYYFIKPFSAAKELDKIRLKYPRITPELEAFLWNENGSNLTSDDVELVKMMNKPKTKKNMSPQEQIYARPFTNYQKFKQIVEAYPDPSLRELYLSQGVDAVKVKEDLLKRKRVPLETIDLTKEETPLMVQLTPLIDLTSLVNDDDDFLRKLEFNFQPQDVELLKIWGVNDTEHFYNTNIKILRKKQKEMDIPLTKNINARGKNKIRAKHFDNNKKEFVDTSEAEDLFTFEQNKIKAPMPQYNTNLEREKNIKERMQLIENQKGTYPAGYCPYCNKLTKDLCKHLYQCSTKREYCGEMPVDYQASRDKNLLKGLDMIDKNIEQEILRNKKSLN